MRVPTGACEPVGKLLNGEFVLKHVNQFLSNLGFGKHRNLDPPHVRRVSAQELCTLYNAGGFEEKLVQGVLREKVTHKNHMGHREAYPKNIIFCASTRECLLIDVTSDDEVARLHWYENKDGSIGASGLRAPKMVVTDGLEYHLPRARKQKPFVWPDWINGPRKAIRRAVYVFQVKLGMKDTPIGKPKKKQRQP